VDKVPARRELVRFLEERIRSQARSGAEAEDNEEEVRDRPRRETTTAREA